jgi:thiamine biosynthesis lipoprotein
VIPAVHGSLGNVGFSPVRLAVHAMGTRFEIVLGGQSAVRLRSAGEAALEEIVSCHRRFTRFSPDSLLSHIVRTAHDRPVRLDADTFALFEEALHVQRESGGAFSISMSAAPAFSLDAAARTIQLTKPHAPLDLGAIAKGHALDLAARVLRESDVSCALLHGGTSSVLAIGAPPGTSGWMITVAHEPDSPSIVLNDRALSVSSPGGCATDRAATGRAHIRDGRNACEPLTDPAEESATLPPDRVVVVVGPNARGADAWSTAIAVLGARPATLGPEWFTWLSSQQAARARGQQSRVDAVRRAVR